MVNKMKILVVLFLILAASALAEGETRFTVEFRGQAFVDGVIVSDGTLITLWDGEILMDTAVAGYGKGYFNHLEIKWDDPGTLVDEGVTYDSVGEEVTFKIGDEVSYSLTVTSLDRGKTIDLRIGEEVLKKELDISLLILVLIVMGIIFVTWYLTRKEEEKKQSKK